MELNQLECGFLFSPCAWWDLSRCSLTRMPPKPHLSSCSATIKDIRIMMFKCPPLPDAVFTGWWQSYGLSCSTWPGTCSYQKRVVRQVSQSGSYRGEMVWMRVSTAWPLAYVSSVCYFQVFASYFMIFTVCDAFHPMGLSARVILPAFHEINMPFHCRYLLEVRVERM